MPSEHEILGWSPGRQFGEMKEELRQEMRGNSEKQAQETRENTHQLVQEINESSEKQFHQTREEQKHAQERTEKQLQEIKTGQVNLKEDLQKGIAQVILQFSQTNGFVKPVLWKGIDKGNKEACEEINEGKEEVKPCENGMEQVAQIAVDLEIEKEEATNVKETRSEILENDPLKAQQELEGSAETVSKQSLKKTC